MDGTSVSSQELYARLGTAAAPVLVDVRRAESFGADDAVITGAMHRPPESASDWRADLPKNREVVVYCVHGHDVSQGVAKTLQNAGIEAAYLEGGIAGWKERHLPTRRKRDASENK
jgi:thiosulfate sulfurtransferase